MAAFTNLEKCALQHNSEELDLTPLQGLPKLQQLYLQGQFKQLHHLPSLTSLLCKDADITATSNCNFGSILQCLVLKNSLLQGIHAQGIQACTALTELVLSAASLLDIAYNLYLDRDLVRVPDGMELLTRLCKLTLSTGRVQFSCRDTVETNLECITGITSLQDLSISCGNCCSDVIKHMTSLKNLTRLVVTGLCCVVHDFPTLTTDFDWCGM